MTEEIAQLQAHENLRSHVHQTLCRHESLLPDQFELHVIPLKQQDASCGLQFLLRGPRSVRLAVWAAEQNVLYFYDARGERFLKQRLSSRPATNEVVATGCPQ